MGNAPCNVFLVKRLVKTDGRLDKDTMQYKQKLSHDFANQVYNGKWETTLTKAMLAFVEETQKTVTFPSNATGFPFSKERVR